MKSLNPFRLIAERIFVLIYFQKHYIMKKIFILSFFLSNCVTVPRIVVPNYLLIAGKPTTVSKATIQKIPEVDCYSVVAPIALIVIREVVYTKAGWKTALVLYYQHKVGTLWQAVDTLHLQGEYPQIQKIEQPRPNVLVVWVTLCKDLTVTRSYVLHGTSWTPQ